MKYDCRDVLVMAIVTAAWGASTWYLFKHPSDVNFATWCGLAVTMTSVYHWLCFMDSKKADA